MTTPRAAILEIIDRNDGLALALARAIRQAECWRCSDTDALKRVRQCLKGTAGRHFCANWVPIFAGLCVDFDEREPVTGIVDEARRDREYELRQERRQMMRVEPQGRARNRGVA